MARDLFSNQGSTTVSSGGTTAPAAGTTESWTVASSATFPAASNATFPTSQFYVSDAALPSETILVTNVSGTTWSVTRGADGTTPVAHTTGFTVRNVVTAAWLQSIDDRLSWDTFNVKDYGAVGDNRTADHVAIQAALDDAWKAGGGQVIVPRGIYRIMNVPLRIRSNVKLTMHPSAEIHRYHDFSSMVWNGDGSQNRAGWTGHGNFIIEGGTWDMRCSTATTALSNDTFTRADTTTPHTLGVMTSGQTWIDETSRGSADQGSGNIGITSNTASAAVAGTNISTVFGWPDGTVSCTIPTVGNAGLVFRMANSQNYWQYTRHTDTNARLSYWVNGTETVVTPTATQAVSAGNTLTVVFYGTTVKAYVGTTLTHDTTDANHSANRKVGIVIFDTTARLDTFANTSQLWTDSFDRANSAVTLGTGSTNMAWTSRAGTLGINTNLAYAPGAGTNISTVPATQETNVDVKVTTAGNAGVVFRYQDASNYWWYRRHTDGTARLSKFIAGVETVITASNSTTVNANDVLQVKLMGWKINCFINYTAASFLAGTGSSTNYTHTVSDSDLYLATEVGIRIDDTTARLDNFDCYGASGGYLSGACFNFGHGENILFRDLTVRDVSGQSHATEIAGCKNVLFDNCTMAGMSLVAGRTSEALQLDLTKANGYFAAFGPHDQTTNRDVVIRGCSFQQSYMPGTTTWDRGVGSHSGTVGVWHDRLRVIDSYFEITERSVRAYNWNNVIITGNNFNSGWGVEVRPIWTSNTSDTFNMAGTQTSASQALQGVVIADNTFNVGTSTAGSSDFAIRVFGETTGHISNVSILGNDIKAGSSGGIWVEYVDQGVVTGNTISNMALRGIWVKASTDVVCAGNSVYNAGDHGITFSTCSFGNITGNLFDTSLSAGAFTGIISDTSTDMNIADNTVVLPGKYGIYVLAGSRIRLAGNYIRGASRNANNTWAAIKLDTTPDDVTISGNITRAFGSGNEATYGLHCSTGTNVTRLDNDFHVGATGEVNVVASAELGPIIQRTATATTAIGTSSTAITGLTMTLPTGTWRFYGWVPIVNVGSPTNTQCTMTGPTVSNLAYITSVWGTTPAVQIYLRQSAFGASGATVASDATNHCVVQVEGTCTVTTAGTFSLALTRTGGTSQTTRIGSYLRAERLTS